MGSLGNGLPNELESLPEESTVEQKERSLCVEQLLEMLRLRFLDLMHGIAGFHVRGSEWLLLSLTTGPSKHKNL
jgi:hypothetical protein